MCRGDVWRESPVNASVFAALEASKSLALRNPTKLRLTGVGGVRIDGGGVDGVVRSCGAQEAMSSSSRPVSAAQTPAGPTLR
jgi:hypothetical protein